MRPAGPPKADRSPASTRTRSWLRHASTVLIIAGTLMLIDAGLTIVWQEPITALIAKLRQDRLEDDLSKLEAAGLTALELEALAGLRTDRRRIAFLARSLERRTEDGDAVGRIEIPRIDLERVVVKGTGTSDLRKGPGIYDQVHFPGVPGTTAIAGHRTTYGAPFRKLDRLHRGDAIVVEMPYARFQYTVERKRIVKPTAIEVLKRVRYDRLVLSACHPLFSAAQRIVVFARLEAITPSRRISLRSLDVGSKRGKRGSRSRVRSR